MTRFIKIHTESTAADSDEAAFQDEVGHTWEPGLPEGAFQGEEVDRGAYQGEGELQVVVDPSSSEVEASLASDQTGVGTAQVEEDLVGTVVVAA